MKITNVILSGGVGSRLWPLSRKSRPKQYLELFDDRSLFELTIKRNRSICDQVLIVGGKDNYQLSRDYLQKSGIDGYIEIVEACPRNTAAAIAFAAFSLNEDDIMLVTPSDHLIEGQDLYEETLRKAVDLAIEDNLVTFGLVASRPETGFGYIEHEGNEVISFREKPSQALAEEFIAKGNFVWNSGMFCFLAGAYLSELQKFEPEVFQKAKQAFDNAKNGFLTLEDSMEIPSISIDYAVMERSDKIKVVPASFDWSDMGSFEALYEYTIRKKGSKADTNLALGSNKHVEFIGVEELILVETADAILVLNKNNAQDVKQVYERLEKENPTLLK